MNKRAIKKKFKHSKRNLKHHYLLLLLLVIFIIAVSLGLKNRLSQQSEAKINFVLPTLKPLPTININIDINLPTIPKIKISIPPPDKIHITFSAPDGSYNQPPPPPDTIRQNPNNFFDRILPIIREIPVD